jgi:hypothetical protein
MTFLHKDLSRWVQVDIDYQNSTKSQADLDHAAAAVRQDLAKAQADAHAVRRERDTLRPDAGLVATPSALLPSKHPT